MMYGYSIINGITLYISCTLFVYRSYMHIITITYRYIDSGIIELYRILYFKHATWNRGWGRGGQRIWRLERQKRFVYHARLKNVIIRLHADATLILSRAQLVDRYSQGITAVSALPPPPMYGDRGVSVRPQPRIRLRARVDVTQVCIIMVVRNLTRTGALHRRDSAAALSMS